jgi:uncharacterized protein YjbK
MTDFEWNFEIIHERHIRVKFDCVLHLYYVNINNNIRKLARIYFVFLNYKVDHNTF